MQKILNKIDTLLPKNDAGRFVAFADSISMGEAREAGYIDEIPAHLDADAPSGYDADGTPLEHSDVVHDFLAHLAEEMQRLHREKQDLWEQVRTTFVQGGIDPDDLTSLSVTKGIRDYVRKSRESDSPTPKQRRMRTYADRAEEAFACTIDDLYEDPAHDYTFEDLPRLGLARTKWLAALREEDAHSGAGQSLLQAIDEIEDTVQADLEELRDVLQRIGSGPWYPERDPETGEYDANGIRSTDWLIDQIVYRLYGLTEEEVRVVEGHDR